MTRTKWLAALAIAVPVAGHAEMLWSSEGVIGPTGGPATECTAGIKRSDPIIPIQEVPVFRPSPYCAAASAVAATGDGRWAWWQVIEGAGSKTLAGTKISVAWGEGDTFELRRDGKTIGAYYGGVGEEKATKDAVALADAICEVGGIP